MRKIEHKFFDDDIAEINLIDKDTIKIDISEHYDKFYPYIYFTLNDLEALAKAMGDNKAERIQLALDLAEGYDGMRTPDGLKSLINDMVKALKGEIEIIDIASHKQEGEE